MVKRNIAPKPPGGGKKFVPPAADSDDSSGPNDSSSDEEDGVFDLGLDQYNSSESGSDDEDDDDENSSNGDGGAYNSEEEDDDASENSDSDDDDEENDLKTLVNNLDPKMRQRVLRKKGDESDEDSGDDSDDNKDKQGTSWGKKKKTYWEGDTADLEIGQDFEDAEDEEAAANELNDQKLQRMTDADFFDNFDDVAATAGVGKNNKQGSKAGAAASSASVEHLNKNIDQLSKDQRLELLAANSPELAGIVAELKERVSELQTRVVPVCEFLNKTSNMKAVDDDIVDYLEVKQQILLSYCVNVVFYLYMKAQGKSVRSHPVMKQLLKLRYVMEKLRPLDGKLKYQIDRLLKRSLNGDDAEEIGEPSSSSSSSRKTSTLRPNPAALLAKGSSSKGKSKKNSSYEEEEEEEDEEEDSDDDDEKEKTSRSSKFDNSSLAASSKQELYKAPRMQAMPYQENESKDAKKERKLEKDRKKMKNSEIMQSIRAEFGDNPEMAASDGLSLNDAGEAKALEEEAQERRDWEESNFVRRVLTKQEKKKIKSRSDAASRLDNFDDIGDIGEFERLAELTGGFSAPSAAAAQENDPFSGGGGGGGSNKGMCRALDALSGSGGSRTVGGAHGYDNDDDDNNDPFAAMLRGHGGEDVGARKRRRAPDDMFDGGVDNNRDAALARHPDSDDDEGDSNGSLLADFAKKKKAFLAKKKEHYTAEPRYGGYEDTVEEGKKRGITYEIMKNRGLTKHRKKEDRNARVKKRHAYDKAVIARKGQVVEVKTGVAGSYGGETTGIKANIARSRKLEHTIH